MGSVRRKPAVVARAGGSVIVVVATRNPGTTLRYSERLLGVGAVRTRSLPPTRGCHGLSPAVCCSCPPHSCCYLSIPPAGVPQPERGTPNVDLLLAAIPRIANQLPQAPANVNVSHRLRCQLPRSVVRASPSSEEEPGLRRFSMHESIVTNSDCGALPSHQIVAKNQPRGGEIACAKCGIFIIGRHRMKRHMGSKSCRERQDLNEQPARVIASLFAGQHIRVRGRRQFTLSGTGELILPDVVQTLKARGLILQGGPSMWLLAFRSDSQASLGAAHGVGRIGDGSVFDRRQERAEPAIR